MTTFYADFTGNVYRRVTVNRECSTNILTSYIEYADYLFNLDNFK